MDDMNQLQALFGGTFDPVHYGHLLPVEALAEAINLARVIIMPNNVPPHRPQPVATSQQRKTMLAMAINDRPLFTLDERELQRDTPSYTAETLALWRQESGPARPLAFIIGQDSLLSFPTWYRYDSILSYCHLIVCRRPGYALEMRDATHQRWLEQHLTIDARELHTLPAGKIFLAQTPWFDISATQIRQRLQQNQPCDDLLPPAVLDYIVQQGLYR